VVKHSTADPGIASLIPPHSPNKITKKLDINYIKDINWFFLGKMVLCISALHWARLRTWFVMCSGRSSILHYGPHFSFFSHFFFECKLDHQKSKKELNY